MKAPRSGVVLALGLALGAALWSLQPAAGDGITGLRALAFWTLHVAVLLPLLYGALAAIVRLPVRRALPPVVSVVLSGILGALAFTPFAIGIDALFSASNDSADDGPFLVRAGAEFLNFVFPVTVVWILINARQLARLSVPHFNATQDREETALLPGEKEFWAQVPAALGHDLVALSAEQHYVRVFTAKGDTLILFAFGRAVAAVARFEGMQVHRSHWVRLAHVTGVLGTSRDLKCQLSNGTVLPVSRTNAGALREAVEKLRLDSIAAQPPDRPA